MTPQIENVYAWGVNRDGYRSDTAAGSVPLIYPGIASVLTATMTANPSATAIFLARLLAVDRMGTPPSRKCRMPVGLRLFSREASHGF